MTVGLLVGALVAMALTVCYSLLGDEARAWIPYLARWLVRSAARKLPPLERDRYEQDWIANVSAWEDRRLAALAKAVHIRLKARGIRESLLGLPARSNRAVRVLDVGVSLFLLPLAAPIVVLVALLIRIGTEKPALRRCIAIGRGGMTFRFFRFTPILFSPLNPEASNPFLRLLPWLSFAPLLLNVLRGDMSLVGPPAPYAIETEHFGPGEFIQLDRPLEIFSVPPGLVCPPEIPIEPESSPRCPSTSSVQSEAWFRRNTEYARTKSLSGDIRVLVGLPFRWLRRATKANR